MGWCGGTQIFDLQAKNILAADIADEVKLELLGGLYDALESNDWDCQHDSDHWCDPLVRKMFMTKMPDIDWDEEPPVVVKPKEAKLLDKLWAVEDDDVLSMRELAKLSGKTIEDIFFYPIEECPRNQCQSWIQIANILLRNTETGALELMAVDALPIDGDRIPVIAIGDEYLIDPTNLQRLSRQWRSAR